MNKQTKPFLYPLSKPSQDQTLEDDLVRTLRLNFTEEYERNEKLIRDAYFQLTQKNWHSIEIVPTLKTPHKYHFLMKRHKHRKGYKKL